ncbi:LuxR family transcriptional regulator [bacterium D16-34]|nr:LuxR family transcriptional regulator [bacterium D16-34]
MVLSDLLPGKTAKQTAQFLCFSFQIASLGLLRKTPDFSLSYAAIENYPFMVLWLARILSVVALAVMVFLLAKGIHIFAKRFLVTASVLLCAGSSLMLYGSNTVVFYAISQILIGISHAYVLAYWGFFLSKLARTQRNKTIAVSALLAVIYFVVIDVLPFALQGPFFLLIICASCFPLLIPTDIETSKDNQANSSLCFSEQGTCDSNSRSPRKTFELMFGMLPAALVVLMGCYAMLFRILVFFDFPNNNPLLSLWSLAGVRVVGMLLLVWYLARRHFCPSVRQIMVPLLLLTSVGVVLLPAQGPILRVLSVSIVQASWTFFYTIIWIALFEIGRKNTTDSLMTFLCGWLLMNMLLLIAAPIAALLEKQMTAGALSMTALVLMVIYMLSVGLLLMRKPVGDFDFRDIPEIDEAPPASNNGPQWKIDRSDFLHKLAHSHKLTPREVEIFELLVQGYSLPAIEERFCLSHSTVKGHTRHIYQKFAVSTKQELIELTNSLASEQS